MTLKEPAALEQKQRASGRVITGDRGAALRASVPGGGDSSSSARSPAPRGTLTAGSTRPTTENHIRPRGPRGCPHCRHRSPGLAPAATSTAGLAARLTTAPSWTQGHSVALSNADAQRCNTPALTQLGRSDFCPLCTLLNFKRARKRKRRELFVF